MMPAIVQSLPLAIGILVSSMPMMVIPLMLITQDNRRAMAGFLAGWLVGFLLVGSVVVILVDMDSPARGGPPVWVDAVRIALGGLLVFLAVRQWLGRPRAGMPVSTPAWMDRIGSLGPPRAAGFGMLMATVNPKYTALIASGAMTIASAAPAFKAQFGALLVFMAISSLGIFAPGLASWWLGERARLPLDRFGAWMMRNNAVIMAVVLSVLGLVLLVNGISGWRSLPA